MDDSDGFWEHLGVSLDVDEIINYWRMDPSRRSGGSQREAGNPEPCLVHNKTTTAMDVDVPVLPLASQIDVYNGEVTWAPRNLHRKPTDHNSSESTLHIVSKEQQQKSIKKNELKFSPCNSGIMSECSAIKVVDPIGASHSPIESDTRQVESNILVKKQSSENSYLAAKAKSEIDSELKVKDPIWAYYAQIESGITQTNSIPVKISENAAMEVKEKHLPASKLKTEDPIWACYLAKQGTGVPIVEKPTCTVHLKEEPVDMEIGSTEGPSSCKRGYSKENSVQLNLTDRCDQDKSVCPVQSEEQTVKNSTVATHNVKHVTLDIKNEDPIWANYHLCEKINLNPKYKHVPVPLPSLTQEHQLPTSKEMLSLRTELTQPINTVTISKPAIKLESQSNKTDVKKSTSNISTFSWKIVSSIIETCPLCNKSLDSHKQAQEKLPTEAVGQGKPNETKPWKCCLCKLTYATFGTFRYHRVKHMSGITCPECGRGFSAKKILESHLKTHSKERPYSCKECGKSFRIPGQLNVHISSRHSTENAIYCPECGKCFRVKSYLDIHMNIHTGNRPYQCTECDASFRTPSALHTHRTIHTGQKPYRCPQCGRCFRLKGFLNNHLATHTTTKGTLHTSGKKTSKKVQEQSDSEDASDSMSDTDFPSDSTPPSPSSRETRSQKRLKQMDD